MDPTIIDQLCQIFMKQQQDPVNEPKSSVKFDKKLLDFDYGEEEDDDVVVTNSPNIAASTNTQHNAVSANSGLEGLGVLLANPEVLKTIKNGVSEISLIGIQTVLVCKHIVLFSGFETVAQFATNHAK